MPCSFRPFVWISLALWFCVACSESDGAAPAAESLVAEPASVEAVKEPDNGIPNALDRLGERLPRSGLNHPTLPSSEAMFLGGLEWLRRHPAEDASSFQVEFVILVVLLGLAPQEGPVRSTLAEMLRTNQRRWAVESNLRPRKSKSRLVFSCVRWMAKRRVGHDPQGEMPWEELLNNLESLDHSDAFLAAALCSSEMPEAGQAELERIREASLRSPEWHRHREQALQEQQWYPFLHDLLSLSGLGSRPLQKVLTTQEWDAIDADLRRGMRELVAERDAYHVDQLAELMVTRLTLGFAQGPLDEEAISAVLASRREGGFFSGDPDLEPRIPSQMLPSVQRHTTLLALWLLLLRSTG